MGREKEQKAVLKWRHERGRRTDKQGRDKREKAGGGL